MDRRSAGMLRMTSGQGAVYYPKVGVVPDAGVAQETFQPFRAVRQNQQCACPSP